jgi:hypothetical protein
MISKVTSVLAKNNNGCRVNGNRTQDQSARKASTSECRDERREICKLLRDKRRIPKRLDPRDVVVEKAKALKGNRVVRERCDEIERWLVWAGLV